MVTWACKAKGMNIYPIEVIAQTILSPLFRTIGGIFMMTIKKIKHFLFSLTLLVSASPVFAQSDSTQAEAEREVWQLSGLIVNQESMDPIPFARLGVLHTRRTSIASDQGFYSIPVTLDDTLYFFCLGFKPSFLVIKEYLTSYEGDAGSGYIYCINYLKEDSISLETISIWPWDTPMELRTALLENKSSHEDELAFARDNLDPQVMEELMKGLPADTDERLNAARSAYYNRYLSAHVAPTASLLNPMAIFALLKYINEKTKEKKRTQDLNTWEE
jgi:hypothetical protein